MIWPFSLWSKEEDFGPGPTPIADCYKEVSTILGIEYPASEYSGFLFQAEIIRECVKRLVALEATQK